MTAQKSARQKIMWRRKRMSTDLIFRKLYASEIECRVSTVNKNGCGLLLYKDARVDQRLLDETVGPFNWQRSHEVINGNLFCNVGIYVRREGGFGEWVWKQDVGKESFTEKEKGQASDAFKRACFNWGIGRELYTAPSIWVGAKDADVEMNNGKYTTKARFRVDAIGYKDNAISYLRIIRTNGGKPFPVYDKGDASTIYTVNGNLADSDEPEDFGGMPETLTAEYAKEHPDEPVNNLECEYLATVAAEHGVTVEEICKAYKAEDLLKLKRVTILALINGDYWGTIKKKAAAK